MAKMKVIPDNETFHFHNENPKGRCTGDCVTRAISAFLEQTWKDTFMELAVYGCKRATDMDCPETYGPYLEMKGYEKQKMPRRFGGKRYTAAEFCKELAEPGKRYILSLAGHLTYIGPDCRIYDTWDCGAKCVGNYWVRN